MYINTYMYMFIHIFTCIYIFTFVAHPLIWCISCSLVCARTLTRRQQTRPDPPLTTNHKKQIENQSE